MNSNADPRALREMVKAAQRQAPPELEWEKLEARLLLELERTESSATALDLVGDVEPESHEVRPSLLPNAVASALQPVPYVASLPRSWFVQKSLAWVAAFSVAAALVAVWFSREVPQDSVVAVVREPIDPMELPAAKGMAGARDLAALKREDVVEAALGPIVFGKLGVLEWTLAAGGRLAVKQALSSLVSGGETQELELESGSLSGAVSADQELVVVAGETQVATIGPSAFSITRSSQRLMVELKNGSASVGPRGQRSDVRTLIGPVRASFSLDGGHTSEIIPEAPVALVPPESSERNAPEVSAVANSPPAPTVVLNSARKAEPSVPDAASAMPAPAPAVPALSDESVRSTLMSCLVGVRKKDQANASSSISVSVLSTLKVETLADGSVRSASFNPPLRADLQNCALFLFRNKLEGGARVLSLPISF